MGPRGCPPGLMLASQDFLFANINPYNLLHEIIKFLKIDNVSGEGGAKGLAHRPPPSLTDFGMDIQIHTKHYVKLSKL